MCVHISVVDVLPTVAIWDPDEVEILVRRGTHPNDAIQETRAILIDLGAPSSALGVLCFCGMPVPIPCEFATWRRQPQRAVSLTRRQVLRGA